MPEPSSSALLGLGGLALILRRRKYKPISSEHPSSILK
ncbi:MAG: PEP-CTERM sorting domain-containing protein [Akkermansiaceae bacterium]